MTVLIMYVENRYVSDNLAHKLISTALLFSLHCTHISSSPIPNNGNQNKFHL